MIWAALPWTKFAAAGVVVAAFGGLVAWHVHRVDLAREQGTIAGRAEVQAKWDKETLDEQQFAARLAAERRTIEQQRNADQRQEVENAQEALKSARGDADRARLESDRLRVAAKATSARCGARGGDPAAAAGSASEPTPGDLLAYLSSRLDEAAGGIATHADTARIEGRTCEALYDSLAAAAVTPILIRANEVESRPD